MKTRRFGYDGKGQATIKNGSDPAAAWRDVGGQPCILEAFVPFEREVSVIAARGHDGAVACFDVTENEHRDHILKFSRVPATLGAQGAAEARRIAETIAHQFAYVGVLAVEMFVLGDGGLLVNEIAPRVHNSGHWTIDGASVSQFEQHIRAVAGWPLGKPLRYGRVEMTNLIGHEVEDYRRWLDDPRCRGAPLRQGRGAARPQNGPCDAGVSGLKIAKARWWTFPRISATWPAPRWPRRCALAALHNPTNPTAKGARVQVLVRDNNVDQALKALKKKMQREGIFREMKLRGHYEKPSEKKAREKAEAIRRARKLARKKLQREGLLPMKPKPTTGPEPDLAPDPEPAGPVRRGRPGSAETIERIVDDGAGLRLRRFFGAPGCYLAADDPVSPRHAQDHAQCARTFAVAWRSLPPALGARRLRDARQSAGFRCRSRARACWRRRSRT